jgi:hypothetical protein
VGTNCSKASRTNQGEESVEGAGGRGDAHEAAPEDDEDCGGSEAGEREDAPGRAAPPLPERLEQEARGAGAGPGHGRPVAVDEVPAAARPGDEVLLGQHPRPPLAPQPQIRHFGRPTAGGREGGGPNWSTAGPQARHFPPVGSKARRNRSPGARERTGFPPKPIKQLQEEGRRPRPAQELVGKRRLWPEKRIERRSYTRPAAEPHQSSAASGPRNGEKSPGERKKSGRWLGAPPTDSWGLDLPSMNRRWEVK